MILTHNIFEHIALKTTIIYKNHTLIFQDGIHTVVTSIEVTILNVQDTAPYFTRAVSTTVVEGIPAVS